MVGTNDSQFEVHGTLRALDGFGSVRIEMQVAAPVAQVWAAVTEPAQLANWLGEISGDLRIGGRYEARLFPSGWDGEGHVLECEPERRWRVDKAEPGGPLSFTEIVLAPEGSNETSVVFISNGMPLDMVAVFGVGNQLQVENLAAYMSGQPLIDPEPFWAELLPHYEELTVEQLDTR
jgi:uncharacterized protein YndB with AHSA1/START domain